MQSSLVGSEPGLCVGTSVSTERTARLQGRSQASCHGLIHLHRGGTWIWLGRVGERCGGHVNGFVFCGLQFKMRVRKLATAAQAYKLNTPKVEARG